MSRVSLFAGAAVCAVLLSGGARAADMPVYYEPVFGGWYLRGDIGITHQKVDSVTNIVYETEPAWMSWGDDFDASWFIGIGFGYQFNDWFRADVTGEFRGPSDYHGVHAFDTDGDDVFDLVDDYTAEKTEWTFLLNGYWDFYTWEKITFFVGAGIGASYNKISDLVDYNVASPDYDSTGFCSTGNGCADDNGKWQFAWALHAGLAFAVAPNIAIEVAYRYLNLGDAESGDLVSDDLGNIVVGNPMEFHDLTSHDVKVGVRYTFY